MLEQNKILFFILVLIVLVGAYFMRMDTRHKSPENVGRNAVYVESGVVVLQNDRP